LYITVKFLNTNATIVGARTWRNFAANRFDLIEATTLPRPPIATPTVLTGNMLFRQGVGQLNGGRPGKVNIQARAKLSNLTPGSFGHQPVTIGM
jgi:hypothetical protein